MISQTSRPKSIFLSRHTCSTWETLCSAISLPRCAGRPMESGLPQARTMGRSCAGSHIPDRHFQQQPLKKNIRSISWSPLGRQLVIAFANKQVLFWNLQTEEVSQAWLPEHPRMVSISHQTGQVAVATEETLFFFEHFDAVAPTTRHPSQLYAAFSADNKLATLDHDDGTELTIWQI